jgi:hypothetical protein
MKGGETERREKTPPMPEKERILRFAQDDTIFRMTLVEFK